MVLDRDDGALLSSVGNDAPATRGQVARTCSGGAHGVGAERTVEGLISVAGLAGPTEGR